MKKTATGLTGLLLIIAFCAFLTLTDQHVGLWKGTSKGEIGYMHLDKSGYAFFIIGQDTIGGPSSEIRGQKASMEYVIDPSKNPKTIDFIIFTNGGTTEIDRLRGIYQFDEQHRLVLCVDFNNPERPSSFEGEGAMVFEKVLEKDN